MAIRKRKHAYKTLRFLLIFRTPEWQPGITKNADKTLCSLHITPFRDPKWATKSAKLLIKPVVPLILPRFRVPDLGLPAPIAPRQM